MIKKTVVKSLTAVIVVLFLTVTGAAADNWLMINEIHYNPADTELEFVELHNAGPVELLLDDYLGLEIDDDVELTFPVGSTMQPGEYIACVNDATDPRWTEVSFQVFELDSGVLANSGDKINLLSPSCGSLNLEDTVTYDNYAPWPEDGKNGYDEELHSIELINPNLDNDNGANWAGSSVVGGTPGAQNSVYTP